MRIGFGAPVSGSWATPENLAAVARGAEEWGYHSLWTYQRLLSPVDAGYGEVYRSVQDPITPLAYAAAVTSRIRLGVAVVNLPFVAPVVLAKQLATVDVLSGGRLDAGLGNGWSPEEFVATGATKRGQGRRAEEFIAVLRRLWTEDVVEFHGEFYQIPRMRMDPKPVQRPHPPIVVGGNSEATIRRIVAHGDGWAGYNLTLDEVARFIDRLGAALEAAGRSLDEVTLRVGRRAKGPTEADWEEDARYIEGCEELGLHEVVVSPRFPVEGYERSARRYAEIVGVSPA